MNLWKSPTGKVRTNNPFGSREQRILDDFSHFEFGGFYDDGNSYRSNFIPIYIVHSKDGAAFEYIFRGGSLKIIGKDGGEFGRGGKTPTNQEVWNKGEVLDSWASDVGGSNQSQDTIIEYNGDTYLVTISMHGEDVINPNSKAKKYKYSNGGRIGKKQIKRKKVTRQYPNYDKEADSGLVAKPQGYRFTEKLAKKLGVKSYAKPTQEQIEKYRGRGVYSENRQDKSDVKPKRTYPSL